MKIIIFNFKDGNRNKIDKRKDYSVEFFVSFVRVWKMENLKI